MIGRPSPALVALAALVIAGASLGAGCSDLIAKAIVKAFAPEPGEMDEEGLPPGELVPPNRYKRGPLVYEWGALPEHWQTVATPEVGGAQFYSHRQGALIAVRSVCNRYMDSPLARLARDLLIGLSNVKILREEEVPFYDRKALDLEVRAELDGVPTQLWVRVLKLEKCIFDFSLTAPPARFEAARPAFETVLKGFRIVDR